MMLTGVPRITQDEDTFRISVNIESIVTDLVCDIARAIVNGEDDEAFNALDDVGVTLEAIDQGHSEFSEQALAQRLYDRLTIVFERLALDRQITMGPHTARRLGEILLEHADAALIRA